MMAADLAGGMALTATVLLIAALLLWTLNDGHRRAPAVAFALSVTSAVMLIASIWVAAFAGAL